MKKEIIVVSFGTSFKETREKTIGAIENLIRETFGSDYIVERAFTSGMIIKKLRERDGIIVNSLSESLNKAVDNGVNEVIIQPTHFMKGIEFEKIVGIAKDYEGVFDSIKLGEPLLYDNDEYSFPRVLSRITDVLDREATEEVLRVLMGHGTDAKANEVYPAMNKVLHDGGKKNYFVGTVEASPSLSDCVDYARANGFKRILLAPLMVVAGDHAINDMASDDEDSWKSEFMREGFSVECYLHGIGEMPEVQRIYVDKIRNLVGS